MSGKGKYWWPDGRMYQGEYKNDKKDGIGKFTFRDGREYEGEWLKDKQHGKGFFTNLQGVKRAGVWKNGERVSWVDNKEWMGKVKAMQIIEILEEKESELQEKGDKKK